MSPHRSTSRCNTPSYTFRDSINKLTIPQPCTNYLRNSFRYSCSVLLNSLPETLRQAEFLRYFKFIKVRHGIHGKQAFFSYIPN